MWSLERLRFVVGRRVVYAFAFMGLCLLVFAVLDALGVVLDFWDYAIAIVFSSVAGWYLGRIWVVTVLERRPTAFSSG